MECFSFVLITGSLYRRSFDQHVLIPFKIPTLIFPEQWLDVPSSSDGSWLDVTIHHKYCNSEAPSSLVWCLPNGDWTKYSVTQLLRKVATLGELQVCFLTRHRRNIRGYGQRGLRADDPSCLDHRAWRKLNERLWRYKNICNGNNIQQDWVPSPGSTLTSTIPNVDLMIIVKLIHVMYSPGRGLREFTLQLLPQACCLLTLP
jgi:hypothetical protein